LNAILKIIKFTADYEKFPNEMIGIDGEEKKKVLFIKNYNLLPLNILILIIYCCLLY